MTDLTRDQRRMNRKFVLDALKDETGSQGGDQAQDRVKAFRSDPTGASTQEFGFVGGLILTRFYIAEGKPNGVERRSLWQNVTERMGRPGVKDPGGWGGDTRVQTLQAIAEEA